MYGTGMQVDAGVGFCHDLFQEQVGKPCCDRTLCAPRKRPVQVSAVGQVAGLIEKAVYVHHGDRNQRAANRAQCLELQQAADYFHTIELVAMYRRGNEQHRPGLAPTNYLDRHAERCGRVEVGHRQVDVSSFTGANFCIADYQDVVRFFHELSL